MIMIHDAYLLEIWTGPFVPFLVFATGFGLSFMLALLFWCEVELELDDFKKESDAYAVPDEDVVVWKELVTFLDAVIYFSVVLTVSRVGLSALLGHGMSVWASTEVKKALVTLVYGFWAVESFTIETNFRASGNEMPLSTFIDWFCFLLC